MNDLKISEFLSSLCEDLSEEEKAFIGLQALISAEISMRRQSLGLSKKELAEKLHVSPALVSKWENGETNFTLKTLVQISLVLDIPMQCPYILTPSASDIPYVK